MIFKKVSRKKVMIALMVMFLASAIAGIMLSAPPASAKPNPPSQNTPITVNGRAASIDDPVPVSAAPAQPVAHVLQDDNYNYKISTHEITTSNTYVYVTDAGNYTFSQAHPWASSYTSLWGNTTAFSGYGIQESGTFLLPTNTTVTINPTNFSVTTTEFSSGTSTNHGNLKCAYNFSQTPETTSCNYVRTNGNLSNFNIVFLAVGGYLNYGGSVYQSSIQTGLISLGTGTGVALGANASPSTWSHYLNLDWTDFGMATVEYGKFTFNSNIYYGVLVQFTQNATTVDPSLAQHTGFGSSCTFSSSVTVDNVIVVVTDYNAVSDTFGTSYSSIADSAYPSQTNAHIFAGVIPTTGSGDVVTFSSAPTLTVSPVGGDCFEVSGISASADHTSSGASIANPTGFGASDQYNVTSFSPASTDFVIAEMSASGCQYTINAGSTPSGFTANEGGGVSDGICTGPYHTVQIAAATWATSWGGGATTANMGTASANTCSVCAVTWSETAASFPVLATVTLPTQCTMDNLAGVVTTTISDSSGYVPSPTTVACDGSSHNVVVQASTAITATEPSDSSTIRQRFSGAVTSITHGSCPSGTCGTWSFINYDELKNSIKFTLAAGTTIGGLTWTYTGYADSSSGVTVCTDSPSSGVTTDTQTTCWSNYNRIITAPAEPSGEVANQRFRNAADGTSTAGTPTSGGNLYTITYYEQAHTAFDYAIVDSGSPTAPTLNYNYLGAAQAPIVLTTSPSASFWTDVNIAYTNPLSGSSSTQRWEANSPISFVLGGITAIDYYHQYLQTVSYTITDGGVGYSAPTFTYTYLGTAGTMYTATTTPTGEWADSTTSWAFTNPLSGSGGTQRWDANTGTSGTVSGAATLNPNYYNQYSYTLSYSVSGGGSPTVPQFSCTQFGSPLGYSLTGTPTVEWLDSGCSYSFTNPAQLIYMPTSSTNKEQWLTGIAASGSVSSSQTIAATYYNQYWLNNTAFALTYVYTGVTQPNSTYQGWVDAGSPLTVVGVYSHLWTVSTQGSLYQTSNGVQFFGNHSVSSFTFTTSPLQVTFIGAKLNMTQFIKTGIGMTLVTVKDNGVSKSFTTTSVTDGKIYKFVGSSNFVVIYSTGGIASLTTGTPIYQPYQTKTFAALSYFWVFYCDGSNINFRTAPDGISWSGPTVVAVCTTGQVFSVAFSGTTVIYARTDGTTVYYRLGTISISGGVGVITWAAAEQTAVASSAGNTYSSVYAAIDTNGYSWISYNNLNGGTDYALVTETQSLTGTWSTAAGFPYQAASSASPYAQEVIPFTAGKVALLWAQTGQKLSVQVWATGTWTSTYQNTNSLVSLYYFSAQSSFDTVNVVFLWDNTGTYTVQLARFNYSPIGFITESTVSTLSTTATSAPVIYKNSISGSAEIVYIGSSNTFYGAAFSAAGALSAAHSIYADTNTITDNDQLDIVPLSDSTTRIGVMFVEGSGSPWELQYLTLYSSAEFELILNPSVGSTSVSASNYFTVSYTLNGASASLQYTGTPINVEISADAGSPVTISGTSSLSNSTKEVWWFQAGGVLVTFAASNTTISYTYYDALAQVVHYAIIGGGSPTAPTLSYTTVPSVASSTDSPLSTVYTLTTSPVTVYVLRASTAIATPQLNGISGEIWTPKVSTWKITTFSQISNPINYYHQYQIGVSYKVLFGGTFTAPSFNYTSDGTGQILVLTNSNQNVYVDVTSAWRVTSPLAGSTGTERASTSPSSGTITTITTYVFTYTHQFGVEFKFQVLQSDGTIPSYSGAPTLMVIQGQARTTIILTTSFVITWVDAGTEWTALNPWISGANTFNPVNAGGIVSAQGTISNTNPITIFYQVAPRCVGNDTTLLAETGCFFPAIFYVFANLMGPFFAGLLIAALCMAIYIKTENGILSVFLFFISAIVLGFLFPPIFGEAIIIGLAAMVTYAIYESVRSQQ